MIDEHNSNILGQTVTKQTNFVGAVSFHLKVPISDLWENGKIYDIDFCRDYICGLKH
jgi:hypothetical protein